MKVERGMQWKDVVTVRDDFVLVDVEDGVKYYEGEAFDGGVLCVEVLDGVIIDVVHGDWI